MSFRKRAPIIIDNGTFEIKAGLSDSKKPIVIPSVIGFELGKGEVRKGDYVCGKDALRRMKKQEKPFTQRYPIQRGMFMNWDQMENMWNHAFQQIGVDPSDHPLFMTCNALTPKNHRESLCEIAFEVYDAPAFYLEMPGVLSFYGAERDTGIAVESGGGVTHVIPIRDGKPIHNLMDRVPIAGQDISEKLLKLILERGYVPDKIEEYKIIQHIKQNMAYVAYDYNDELNGCKENPKEFTQELELKSGEKIILDMECFTCAEILFDPTLCGVQSRGLGKVLFDIVNKFDDDDEKKEFYRNIVLGGNNCLLPGLTDRVEKELKDLAKQDGQKFRKINPHTCEENSAWLGARKIASKLNWITQDDYKEYGANIVYKKCW